MRQKLINIKEILVSYVDVVKYDEDSIEYLIDTIDYLLQDKIPCNQAVLSIVLEDMMIASTYHKSNKILEAVSIMKQIIEMVGGQSQVKKTKVK